MSKKADVMVDVASILDCYVVALQLKEMMARLSGPYGAVCQLSAKLEVAEVVSVLEDGIRFASQDDRDVRKMLANLDRGMAILQGESAP